MKKSRFTEEQITSACSSGLGSFFRKCRKLRQFISDIKPRRLVGNKNMKLGFYPRIIIERTERKSIGGRVVIETAKQRRSTDVAKTSMIAGRRLVIGHKFFTSNPSEVCCSHASTAAERRAVRFAAH